jgi:predicted porin
MKKLLIATAALAMVAGTAQAQSSVTVYGVIDMGYSSVEHKSDAATPVTTTNKGFNSPNGSTAFNNSGEAASSRLGFRGSEDLGGGLKANFVIESGMSQNTVFTLGNRAYWAGIESKDMGEVRIGRQDSLIRSVWLGHDQLAFANVVGNLAHSDVQAGGAPTASHTNRFVGLNYLSPRFNGIQLVGSVMQQNTETSGSATTKNASGSQVGANYLAGKFSVAAAYAEYTQDAVTATGAFDNTATSNATQIGVAGVDAIAGKVKETGAGASYDFGVAKVGYVYNKVDRTTTIQRESHAFSASIPLGAKLVGRVGYGFGDYKATPTGVETDIKGMQAALNYNLSKRTMVYGIYGQEERDSATAGRPAFKSTEYSVGVRHSF